MRRYMLFLVALVAAVLTFSPSQAFAAPYGSAYGASLPQIDLSKLLHKAGYYGGGDYYGENEGRHKKHYEEDDDDGGYEHKRHYRPERDCNKGCYKKKWVCESAEPRCRKERECVWHYGKEYCRYVRRCYGDTGQYCKWITVESNHCGYRRCW
jgi:hypothetical protein